MRYLQSAAACAASAALLLGVSSALVSGKAEAAPPPQPAAAVQSGFGTIKGKLVWGGAEAPKPTPITNITKDPQVCGANPLVDHSLLVDPATKGIAYAFAYLPTPKGANPEALKAIIAKTPTVSIDQKGCEFVPFSSVIVKGQALDFKSSDPVGHNVRYGGFNNPSKNVALGPNGHLEVQLVPERRPMELQCDLHPWMKGWIMCLDHPFFAVTAADGSFEIQGVPAGEQNLIVWQNKVGYVTEGLGKGVPVTVTAGATTDIGTIKLDPSKIKTK